MEFGRRSQRARRIFFAVPMRRSCPCAGGAAAVKFDGVILQFEALTSAKVLRETLQQAATDLFHASARTTDGVVVMLYRAEYVCYLAALLAARRGDAELD